MSVTMQQMELILEKIAPVRFAEEWDNSGFNVNFHNREITGIMICLDVLPEIIEEAEKSVEAGQKKYRAYFVKTRLYKRWKDNVDTILKTDGYDEVIVEN